MKYKILEVHTMYKNDQIEEISVLWESNPRGWVRASYATSNTCYGYKFIMPGEELTPGLIQEVAGYGMNLPDDKKKIYFPGNRNWEQ